ncbi:MAG: PLP-dependent cysteine synthase family protein, partial [Luteimonas sp.]
VACLQLAAGMRERGESGSIVTLLCDRGERYHDTVFDPGWLSTHGIELQSPLQRLRESIQ